MKKDNKGFSLVELIIVIAIMAVLIGVLAPQFSKYIERGRKSTDVQNVAEVVSALEVYAMDPMVAAGDKLKDGAIVTLSTSAATVSASSNADKALNAAGIQLSDCALSSSQWFAAGKTSVNLTVTIAADGTVTITEDTSALKTDHSLLKGEYK